MTYTGAIIRHKVFGAGEIIACDERYVTVLFKDSKEEKQFLYPSA